MEWKKEEIAAGTTAGIFANPAKDCTLDDMVVEAIMTCAVELAAARDGGKVAAGLIQRYRNENERLRKSADELQRQRDSSNESWEHLRSELTEARATIARLTAAGQALSEHADKAGEPEPTTQPVCTGFAEQCDHGHIDPCPLAITTPETP